GEAVRSDGPSISSWGATDRSISRTTSRGRSTGSRITLRDSSPRGDGSARAGGDGMLQSRWAMLVVVFLTRTSMGFMFQSVASVAPFLIAQFGLSYGQLGFLVGLFLLPGAVISLPGGLLGQRFGSRRVAVGGLVLMIAGALVTAWSTTFFEAGVGRTVSGAG